MSSVEQNKALVRRVYQEMLSEGNVSLVDELFSPDYLDHTVPPDAPQGASPFKQYVLMLRTAYPDIVFTVDDVIAEGDKVVIHYRTRGTNLAPYFGAPPTGKVVRTHGIDILRVTEGKVREHWGLNNYPGTSE